MLNREVKQRIAENKQRRAFTTKTRRMLKQIGMSQRVAAQTTPYTRARMARPAGRIGLAIATFTRNSLLSLEDADAIMRIGPAITAGNAMPIGSAADIEQAFRDVVAVGGLSDDERAKELTLQINKDDKTQ